MTHIRHIFLFATLLLSAMFFAPCRATAQFSMDTVEPETDGGELSAPITLNSSTPPPPLNINIINAAKAKATRRALWRSKNSVDFKVSLTGILTQYNKAWTTNNQNSISAELTAYYYHTYTKDIHTSIFKFDGQFGMNYIEDIWFKNEDALKLYYLASWKIKREGFWKDWAYSVSTTLNSQFMRGYKSRDEPDVVWSNFMAPGTVNLGAGVTYTSPNIKLPFIVTLNPISANGLFVADRGIDDERRRSLGILVPGSGGAGVYKHNSLIHKIEGGSNLNIAFNRTFTFGKRGGIILQYNTTMTSFYGWITEVAKDRQTAAGTKAIVPTFNWTNSLSFTPWQFIILEFRTVMKYDRSQVAAGENKAKLQMQYYVRVGITYRYKNR